MKQDEKTIRHARGEAHRLYMLTAIELKQAQADLEELPRRIAALHEELKRRYYRRQALDQQWKELYAEPKKHAKLARLIKLKARVAQLEAETGVAPVHGIDDEE
jgi:CelD/BcsL family acetyltransferase involved in cellulose biosynthesis